MRFVLFVFLALAPAAAQAHTGHEVAQASSPFLQGALHPLSGADHLLAMMALGAVFGAVLGPAGILLLGGPALSVETGIALSLVVFGALLASGRALPLFAALTLSGIFAWFHGFAHGAEAPQNASGALYGAGFLIMTATLIALGAGTGLQAQRHATGQSQKSPRLPRIAGVTVGFVGLGALAGWL